MLQPYGEGGPHSGGTCDKEGPTKWEESLSPKGPAFPQKGPARKRGRIPCCCRDLKEVSFSICRFLPNCSLYMIYIFYALILANSIQILAISGQGPVDSIIRGTSSLILFFSTKMPNIRSQKLLIIDIY